MVYMYEKEYLLQYCPYIHSLDGDYWWCSILFLTFEAYKNLKDSLCPVTTI